ncbi:MAG: magnesium/cobalt transporter CorA [Bacteroidia bacterium]|jgi:magnesium transporter|nr:magnesium/cobalt transporter CorA [Bacteroidia bacterium]GIV22710.1 MAG: magnesium transport protein CorA [Bacteroidia bacterium]
MLRAYQLVPYIQQRWEEDIPEKEALDAYVWIDVCSIPREKLEKIERYFSIRFPSKQEVVEIEATSRYHEENGQTRLIVRLIEIRPAEEGLVLQEQDLSIIWLKERLFTYREHESKVFQELIRKLKYNPDVADNPLKLLLAILGQIVDVDADNIELISQHIYRLSSELKTADFEEQQRNILQIQTLQEFLIRLREGLFDIQRVLSLMIRSERLTDSPREIVRTLLKDISSLIDHTNFGFQRLESLQNTILSLINLEQNRIIKIFTVITVAFMPPTLIASIYGMNFRYMPELEWQWGYAFAWFWIVASSVVTLWYFRWKRWL